jgi:hypothetical protein
MIESPLMWAAGLATGYIAGKILRRFMKHLDWVEKHPMYNETKIVKVRRKPNDSKKVINMADYKHLR